MALEAPTFLALLPLRNLGRGEPWPELERLTNFGGSAGVYIFVGLSPASYCLADNDCAACMGEDGDIGERGVDTFLLLLFLGDFGFFGFVGDFGAGFGCGSGSGLGSGSVCICGGPYHCCYFASCSLGGVCGFGGVCSLHFNCNLTKSFLNDFKEAPLTENS